MRGKRKIEWQTLDRNYCWEDNNSGFEYIFSGLSLTAIVKDYYQHKACLYSNYLVNKLACHYFSSQLQAA